MVARLGNLIKPVHWGRDYLPDYLWVCSQLIEGSDEALIATGYLLDRARDLAPVAARNAPHNWVPMGTLSSWEAFPQRFREEFIRAFIEIDGYDLLIPDEFAHVLLSFDNAPGSWLMQPKLDRGFVVDRDIARTHLGEIVALASAQRGRLASRVKVAYLRQAMSAGRISVDRESMGPLFEILPRYPSRVTEGEAQIVEGHARAIFLAMTPSPDPWVPAFWRSAWFLFPCEWPTPPQPNKDADGTEDELCEFLVSVNDAATAQWDRFFAISRSSDPDLYDPDRFEVLTGITGRVLRYLLTLARHPALWQMENGAPVLRSLVETEITLKYILTQEGEGKPLYARFKAFGIGHLKLQKLHLEEYVDKLDEPPQDLLDQIEYLDMLVNRDTLEEYQTIDIGGNFAQIDMRKMAIAVGMENEYRLLFAPASSNVHGEWSVVDDNVFVTCANPIHRGHRIVGNATPTSVGANFIASILSRADGLLDAYDSAMQPGEELTTEPAIAKDSALPR